MTGAFLKGAAYGDDSGDARHPGRGIFTAFGRENRDSEAAHAVLNGRTCGAIPAADAVVACGALPGEIIRRGRKLRIIAGYGAGYDGVDVHAAAECGIPVTNLPDTVTDSTAELAIGLMLAVSRRIGENSLRAREEAPENLFGMGRSMGRSLRGQTLGLLGCGRIGKRTAEIAAALGMRCIGYSRHGVNHPQVESVTLPELLAQSDVLSLHCPLTQETRRLLDRSALARMKQGSILINTARGAIVDCDALADALESEHLRGAGLDVYPDEPHIPPRLIALPQVVLTPHIGTNTQETRQRMAEECARQIADALAGKRPAHVVNGVE